MDLGDVIAFGGLAGLGIMTLRWAMGRNSGEQEPDTRGEPQQEPSIEELGDYSIADTHKSANDLTRTLKRKISQNRIKVLGFDCEFITYPQPRQKVSLLQIATPDGFCALFRLGKLGGVVPQQLKEILEDSSILKVGVSVVNDAEKLQTDYELCVKGCLDVQYLADIGGVSDKGLKNLVKQLCENDQEKKQRNKRGNWEENELSGRQIKYACYDARYSYLVFEKLNKIVSRDQWSRYIDMRYRENAVGRDSSIQLPDIGSIRLQ